METSQLKRSLHELIEQTGDDRLLEVVYTLLNRNGAGSAETGFVLDTRQKTLLDKAIAECDANPGGGESWEAVRTRILAGRR